MGSEFSMAFIYIFTFSFLAFGHAREFRLVFIVLAFALVSLDGVWTGLLGRLGFKVVYHILEGG